MKTRELLLRLIFILNLCAAGALGLAMLALYISPETFWMLAFAGLSLPIGILINIAFVVFWLFFYRRRAGISIIALIITFPEFGNLFQANGSYSLADFEEIAQQDSGIHILSYNVRLFDLYNWSENKTTRNNIIDIINREKADIICFQEFFYEDTGTFNTLDTLKRMQKAKNIHIEHTAHVKKVNHWGIATFTKYPIVKKGVLKFRDSTDNISIYTDIKVFDDTIRLYNLHLESIRFRSEDYKALQKFTGNEDNTKLGGPQQIVGRMRKAFIRRARQSNIIKKSIAQSPHPVIVCGDFNDPPSSYTYHSISKLLDDSFRESGSGIGTTYIGLIPFLRIDYILFSPDVFTSMAFRVIRERQSDHYPIASILKYNRSKALEFQASEKQAEEVE
jgi:endonuclease/exonuclease/phosphatase family metal-dependent hydrolase